MGAVRELSGNYEIIAGTGEQCVPGDPGKCGDGGLAVRAHLSYPKGFYSFHNISLSFSTNQKTKKSPEEVPIQLFLFPSKIFRFLILCFIRLVGLWFFVCPPPS